MHGEVGRPIYQPDPRGAPQTRRLIHAEIQGQIGVAPLHEEGPGARILDVPNDDFAEERFGPKVPIVPLIHDLALAGKSTQDIWAGPGGVGKEPRLSPIEAV